MANGNFCFGCGAWAETENDHVEGCAGAMNGSTPPRRDPGPMEPDTRDLESLTTLGLLGVVSLLVGLAVNGAWALRRTVRR